LTQQPAQRKNSWAVYLTYFIVLALTLIFVWEFVSVSQSEMSPTLSANSETSELDAVLANGNPANGETLLTTYGCIACHRSTTNIAPSFEGIAERAAEEQPPLTAAQYIHESIINPNAFVVEGYPPAMPPNYADRLSDQELADIIAYLLSDDAH
jgi:cytochrome c551/c552